MECREITELMDSYLCDELATETNLTVIRHTEECAMCRQELAARRQLRSQLRSAEKATPVPPDLRPRIQQRLRAEMAQAEFPITKEKEAGFFSRFFAFAPMPRFAFAALLLCVMVGAFYFFQQRNVYAAEISPNLWNETAADHDHCSAQWLKEQGHPNELMGADKLDVALKNLPQLSHHESLGLTLHHAHVCAQAGREFAHLVYSNGNDLVSLFITQRNEKALKSGNIPSDDGVTAGVQEALSVKGKFHVSAVQTAKYIVLIASPFTGSKHKALVETLAVPISQDLRTLGK